MATPQTPTGASFGDTAESAADWARLHTRQLAIGGVAVAVLALAAVLYSSNQRSKAGRAEAALVAAQQPLATNDFAAAERELARVSSQYGGTVGGTQAALLLARVMYEQGKFKEGITVLEKLDADGKQNRVAVQTLIAGGHEGLRQFAEAAKAYEEAAAAAEFPADRDNLRASAARAYGFAGNAAEAKRLWTELAADERGPVAGEARIRLGELTGAAGKS
jgi:tetratricopeptide (TPR) repeat protein